MASTIPPWLLSAQAQKANEASMSLPVGKKPQYNSKGSSKPQAPAAKSKNLPPIKKKASSRPGGFDWKGISAREKALEAQQKTEKNPAKKAAEHKEELRLEALMKKATAARMARKNGNAVQSKG